MAALARTDSKLRPLILLFVMLSLVLDGHLVFLFAVAPRRMKNSMSTKSTTDGSSRLNDSVSEELKRNEGTFYPDHRKASRAVKVCVIGGLMAFVGLGFSIALPDENSFGFLVSLSILALIGNSFWRGIRDVKTIRISEKSVVVLPINKRFSADTITKVSVYNNFSDRKTLRLSLSKPVFIPLVGAALGLGRTVTIPLE